ncbi:tRNA (adenosine(37)-N6)-threonylcarbamoyltransferase complex ATPase subunit type 1 TsaE, partial [uncultured Fusobacterium sp.]
MNKVLTFEELNLLAEKLADFSSENTVIALIGDLGTGKTTFSQKFAKRLGVNENIKSPTFNYVLEYLDGRLPLYHFDVYRLGEAEEIYEVGYEDYL